jgi:iron complex transport system substrate-binding protein
MKSSKIHLSFYSRVIVLLTISLTACVSQATPTLPSASQPAQNAPAPIDDQAGTTQHLEANLSDGCVEEYSPDVDYFPEKAVISYATGFEVIYHNNYKVVTVTQKQADTLFEKQYVLVQCGTPTPQGFDPESIVQIPVKTVVSMSTTHFPFLEEYGVLDRLVGIDDDAYVSNPTVLRMVRSGKVSIVGAGAGVNVEKLIEMHPDLIFAYSTGIPNYDAFPKLITTHLMVALVGEHTEATPLGRAEWGKFIALFFNREEIAEKAFSRTEENYLKTVQTVSQAKTKPTVFLNSVYQGTWYMAGGKSFMACLMADAGADYLWKDDPATGSVTFSFEEVLNRAVDADYWLPTTYWQTTADALKEDERYANFKAFQTGNIYNNNVRISSSGGNDFYESGTAHPDVVLADLVKIFHPDLLPEHVLVYFQKLPASP